MLLPDPRHAVRGRLSSPTSRSTCQAPPHILMLRTQAVGMKSCRPRSSLLTWHPSASTADSLLFSGPFISHNILAFYSSTRTLHSLPVAPQYVCSTTNRSVNVFSYYRTMYTHVYVCTALYVHYMHVHFSCPQWSKPCTCLPVQGHVDRREANVGQNNPSAQMCLLIFVRPNSGSLVAWKRKHPPPPSCSRM
jgi:hypothetical protein